MNLGLGRGWGMRQSVTGNSTLFLDGRTTTNSFSHYESIYGGIICVDIIKSH